MQTARFLIGNGTDNEELDPEQRELVRQQDYARLEAMVGYCKTQYCLRGYILEYFGQKHPEVCGNCGSCRGEFDSVDMTREAQMILSCVKRIRDKLGYDLGISVIGRVLRGSRDKRILELKLDELSTYGLLKDRSRSEIHRMADHLEAEGYLYTDPEHQAVQLTPKAGEVLYRGKKVQMLVQKEHDSEAAAQKLAGSDAELFDVLKELRAKLAKEAGLPAYVIFSNATLTEMARRRPGTMSAFRKISGVGEIKAAWYGTAFLKRIQKFIDENE